MTSTGLNFSALTPDNGAVRELSQLVFENVVGVESLGSILNVLPKQKNGDRLGLVGEFGLVGKAGQGCKPTYGNSAINTTEKEWSIKEWEIAESICYKDLEGTLAQVGMKTKTSRADLTSTEYLAEVVQPRLELAIKKMMFRLAWFGDTNAEVNASGGVLKSTTDKTYFNVIDGLWKRLFAIGAGHADQLTKISANAETTFASQKSAILGAGVATGILDQMIMDAKPVLRQAPNQVIYITQSLKDALDYDLKHNNKGSDLQWAALFDGIQESNYNGIKLVVLPMWDEIIKTYESVTGDKSWNKPYRAVYTDKDNLLVGLESESEIAEVRIWFDETDKMNYIDVMDKLGTLIAQDDLVQVAY